MSGVKRDCQCPRARHKHGTRAAWERDRCRCLLCRAAHANSTRAYRTGGSWNEAYRPSLGTVRRLRALAAAGVTSHQIAAHTGLTREMVAYLRRGQHAQVTHELADLIVNTYEALWDAATGDADSQRCATLARNAGWLPPMAWDDDTIDDPNTYPIMRVRNIENPPFGCFTDKGGRPANPGHDGEILDEIAIEEAIAGRPVRLTRAEATVAQHRMRAMGYSQREIAERLRIAKRTVERRGRAA